MVEEVSLLPRMRHHRKAPLGKRFVRPMRRPATGSCRSAEATRLRGGMKLSLFLTSQDRTRCCPHLPSTLTLR